MAANMYDVGVPISIVDTYVPIDFKNLYLIGALQRKEIDKATEQLNTAIQKFGEFYSPSDIDTENWYKHTLKSPAMQSIIQEAYNNPDALKDAGWRSRLNAGLMGIDYSELSKLKQSKEGMLARQKANQELMLHGGYNPLLHDVDFSNYDTLESGIYNDISPLPYKSTVEMVQPFVDNLKPEFMGTENGWILNGVSRDRTDEQVEANWSSIVTSPHYAQNLELIKRQNPGIDDDTAKKMLDDQIVLAGREFAHVEKERDPMVVAYAKEGWRRQRQQQLGQQLDQLINHLNLTQTIGKDASDTWDNYLIRNGIPLKQTGDVKRNYNRNHKIVASLNSLMNEDIRMNHSISSAMSAVVKQLSSGIGAEANKILTDGSGTLTGVEAEKGFNLAANTGDFLLRKTFVDNMTAYPKKPVKKDNGTYEYKDPKYIGGSETLKSEYRPKGAINKFKADFEKGGFKNVLFSGEPTVITDGEKMYHTKYVYIPESQTSRYSAWEIAEVGGSWVELTEDQVGINLRVNDSGDTSTSTSTRASSKYIQIPAYTTVPTDGQPAIENDALHAKTRGISQDSRELLQMFSEMTSEDMIPTQPLPEDEIE